MPTRDSPLSLVNVNTTWGTSSCGLGSVNIIKQARVGGARVMCWYGEAQARWSRGRAGEEKLYSVCTINLASVVQERIDEVVREYRQAMIRNPSLTQYVGRGERDWALDGVWREAPTKQGIYICTSLIRILREARRANLLRRERSALNSTVPARS